MNQRQYDIVKIFTNLNADPKKISKSFKISQLEVLKVAKSYNYEQYNDGDILPNFLEDLGLGFNK